MALVIDRQLCLSVVLGAFCSVHFPSLAPRFSLKPCLSALHSPTPASLPSLQTPPHFTLALRTFSPIIHHFKPVFFDRIIK